MRSKHLRGVRSTPRTVKDLLLTSGKAQNFLILIPFQWLFQVANLLLDPSRQVALQNLV